MDLVVAVPVPVLVDVVTRHELVGVGRTIGLHGCAQLVPGVALIAHLNLVLRAAFGLSLRLLQRLDRAVYGEPASRLLHEAAPVVQIDCGQPDLPGDVVPVIRAHPRFRPIAPVVEPVTS